MILPSEVAKKRYSSTEWPVVHLWANGTVIVEEKSHVLIWDEETDLWRRYEWAALSDFPRADHTLTGLTAIRYILDRSQP